MMSGRNWQNSEPNFSDQLYNQSTGSFQSSAGGPSGNSLYSERRLLSSSGFTTNKESSFPNSDTPPWQKNREKFGSSQEPRINTPPWSRGQRQDSWPMANERWNAGRSNLPKNEMDREMGQPNDMQFEGGIRQLKSGDYREERQQPNLSNEGNRGMRMDLMNPSSLGTQRSSVINSLMSNYDNSQPPQSWSGRSQGQLSYDEFKGPDYSMNRKPMVSGMPSSNSLERFREERWDNNFRKPNPSVNRFNDFGDNQNRFQNDNRMTESSIFDRNSRPRNADNEGLNNRRGFDDMPQQDFRNSNFMDRSLNSSGYNNKRGRSPIDGTIWNRLQSFNDRIDDSFGEVKRFRPNELNVSGFGFSSPGKWNNDQFPPGRDSPFNDLRMKLTNSDSSQSRYPRPDMPPSRELSRPSPRGIKPLMDGFPQSRAPRPDFIPKKKSQKDIIPVLFCTVYKKSKLSPSDFDQFCLKLTDKLYRMTASSDIDALPQLRFQKVKLTSPTCITVECHDTVSATWLLNWNILFSRIKLRSILPADPNYLAYIGFHLKLKDDCPCYVVKSVLTRQNLNIDTSTWMDGPIKSDKKGRYFVFRVDGQTIRYLNERKWQLHFGMSRIFVRCIKSNVPLDGDYTPTFSS